MGMDLDLALDRLAHAVERTSDPFARELVRALGRVREGLAHPKLGPGKALQNLDAALRPLFGPGAEGEGRIPSVELSEALAHALVSLFRVATSSQQLLAARRIVLQALSLILADPYVALLDPALVGDFRPEELSGARRAAHRVLAIEADAIEALTAAAAEPPDPHPADDVSSDTLGADRLRRTVRLLLWFISTAHDAERRSWSRACALLWGDVSDDVPERAAVDDSETRLVRAAAILRSAASAIARGKRPELLARLIDLVRPHENGWGEPWAPDGLFAELGDPDAHALLSPTARVHFGETSRVEHLTRALLAALDVFPDRGKQRAALAGNLVTFALGARALPPFGEHADQIVPTLEELEPLEREVLHAIARAVGPFQWRFDVSHSLFGVGLPASWAGLRRYLGIDPPGPMDALVEVADEGETKTLPLGHAAQRMLAGRVDEADLGRAMARALDPATLLYTSVEAFVGFDVRLHCTGPDRGYEPKIFARLNALRVRAILEKDANAMLPLVVKRADRLLDGVIDDDLPPRARAVLLLVLSRLLDALGEALPVRFDPLVEPLLRALPPDPATTREILSRIPEARRDAIILAACGNGFPGLGGDPHDYSDMLSRAVREHLRNIP